MLINVRHDREFQRFLDVAEQRLHVAIVPILAAGIRLQMTRGGVYAQHYVRKRGAPVLLKHYKDIYRECFDSVWIQIENRKRARAEIRRPGRNAFMEAQLASLETEADQQFADISLSLSNFIHDRVMAGVSEGRSNDDIAADLYADVPDISQNRAATIARTETHNSALDAIDETLDFEEIDVQKKQWWTAQDARVRPSHAAMHGVTIPYDEPFELDGGDMMRPGDDSLGVDEGEIINCRCSVLYFTESG